MKQQRQFRKVKCPACGREIAVRGLRADSQPGVDRPRDHRCQHGQHCNGSIFDGITSCQSCAAARAKRG